MKISNIKDQSFVVMHLFCIETQLQNLLFMGTISTQKHKGVCAPKDAMNQMDIQRKIIGAINFETAA